MMAKAAWQDRITADPAILLGKPTIRGLRISVEQVLKALADDVAVEDLLQDYPELEREDIRACLAYAADLVADERVYSVAPRSPWRFDSSSMSASESR
jgi:uncharacterized protein (DUF433 family)